MNWRRFAVLACAFAVSTAALGISHYADHPAWLDVHAVPGGDGILWQVQTTFLSVGFAGLAIAAQLFAEAPLAIGASRGRVLEYVWAGWFAGVGLVANSVIAVETIWLPSDQGILAVVVLWFVPTVIFLVLSTLRLMQLFSHPSLLDEVVRSSLVESLATRLDKVSRSYAASREALDGLFASGISVKDMGPSGVILRVPVPRAGLVIKSIKPDAVRQAMATLAPQVTEGGVGESGAGDLYTPSQITLDVEPGDRTRLGETAFRVGSHQLNETARERLIDLLQSSIEFESPRTVTPDEETDREIGNLKDTIGTSLRAGAYGTAERALELLGQVVRGVWMARPEGMDSSRRSSSIRRNWLFRSIGEVEQDFLLSSRAAGLFVEQAMARSLEAPRTGSVEYVDECLRSFTRLWYGVLRHGGNEFDSLSPLIATSVQNLAAFSFATVDQAEDLQARGTWTMVELVKSALDAKNSEAARLAARELNGLFEYSSRGGTSRAHVRAGQLVLSGWLDYLADKGDRRDPADADLRALVTPRGTWSEILSARSLNERDATPFSRWEWWEMDTSTPGGAQVLQLSSYIDRAEVAALASSQGPLPPANDQETASAYQRFTQLLNGRGAELSTAESTLKQKFTEEVSNWEAAENDRLGHETLSQDKIATVQDSLRESLNAQPRLAAEIPTVGDVSDVADASRPILGMNFRVPRHYLVDKVFNQTYADPGDLGQMIARSFAEGEEHKIVGLLRSHQHNVRASTGQDIREQIDTLGEHAAHYVLVTPYGGLPDMEVWYSPDFRESLSKVSHYETAALEDEAILFDRRSALISYREPEEKTGLTPIAGASIALGVFEDVHGEKEPQVRIETGEFFVVWGSEVSGIHRFALDTGREGKETWS